MATSWTINGYLTDERHLINQACEQGMCGGEFTAARAAAYLRSRGYEVKLISATDFPYFSCKPSRPVAGY